MRPIGDFADLTKRSLGDYLAGDPPAVLILDHTTRALQPIEHHAKKTISRQEHAFRSEPGNPDQGLPREQAFMVLPLDSRKQPPERRLLVGRAEHCDVRIGDPSISREHARIDRTDDGYTIQDLGSRVGTEVGVQLLEPGTRRPLSSGAHLRFGTVDFTFLDAAAFYQFVKNFLGE
jgi:hypothetical protein